MPMADRTSSSIVIDASAPAIMAVIADFPAYPGWAEGITAAEVLTVAEDGRAEQVRITLEAGPIKDTYVLAYDWVADDAVHWNLVEAGTMLTGMTGAYRLAPADGSTEVTYELAVDVRIPMIGMVRRKAEKRIIETALKGLKRRVEA
jgi:polyketide cyclase/dehydrase/lipid transport protein